MTNNPLTSFLNILYPPEWHHAEAVVLAWPHCDTDWAYMLDEVRECYINLIRAFLTEAKVYLITPYPAETRLTLEKAGLDMQNIVLVNIPTNDTWTRDYGPITVFLSGKIVFNDFKFNGWGLKFASDKDNLVNKSFIPSFLSGGEYVNRLSFVLEGGSIETDGNGTLMTTYRCQRSYNRNGGLSMEEINRYLTETLGIKKILYLRHGFLAGDDTDGHIDTLARFAPDSTLLYVKCYDREDIHFTELAAMEKELKNFTSADGNPYRLVPLPLPSPVYRDGERLPATYANFLVLNSTVFVPTYRQPDNDKVALDTIAKCFPEKNIIGLDCSSLIAQHGSLHCATMQIPSLNR